MGVLRYYNVEFTFDFCTLIVTVEYPMLVLTTDRDNIISDARTLAHDEGFSVTRANSVEVHEA